jgi:hypothetical protein
MCRLPGLGLLRRSEGRQKDLDEADPWCSMVWGASLVVLLSGLFFDIGFRFEADVISP